MRKLLSAIRDGVIEEWMGRIAVALIIIPVVLNILNRQLFKSYSISLESIALFAYVWIGYGFFGYLYHVDEHLDVKFVTNLFSPLGKKILDLLRDVFCFIFSVFMTVVGTDMSLTIGYASILFGFFDGALRCLCMMIRHLMGWSKKEEKEDGNDE